MIGPWVTPDNAMKKVAQSELKVRGPAPRPRCERFCAHPRFPSFFSFSQNSLGVTMEV